MSMLSLAIYLAAFPVAMILIGLIGRRVKVPPFCRACGYSLVGSNEAERCPECGAGLLMHGSVSRQRRQRRPRVVIAGLVLLLLYAVAFGPTVYQRVTGVNPYRYVPASWLMRIASNGNAPDALDELHDRLKNGRLSRGQITALIETALAVQADAAITWDVDWGNIIETAEGNGQVTAEQFARYARTAAESALSLEVRPRVRKGYWVPCRINQSKARTGEQGLKIVRSDRHIDLSGVRKKRDGRSSGLLDATTMGWAGCSVRWNEQFDRLPLGPQTATVLFQVRVYRHDATPFVCEFDLELESEWTLVPADEPTARFVNDETARDVMVAKISVDNQAVTYNVKKREFEVRIQGGRLPYDLACDIWIEGSGNRWGGGSINISANHSSVTLSHGDALGFKGNTVDIVLEPSLDVAEKTVNCTAIWGERIVIKDVMVNRR